ncbi:MAG: hypothetical protein HOP27_08675 [Anaerolineales bacterium]|nr:hypothetical protein [Anaerolineales bacterium]
MTRFLKWKLIIPVVTILTLAVATALLIPRLSVAPEKVRINLKDTLIFPKLSGTFKVGRTTVYLKEKSRPALFDKKIPREWVVTIFYPAIPETTSTPGPYAEEPLKTVYTNYALTEDSAGVLDRISSNAYWNAPADHSHGAFPVLLFSPGGGEQPLFYSALLEQISSHGYVVVAVPEPFDTPVIPLPGERILTSDQMAKLCEQDEACKKAMSGGESAIQEVTDKLKDNRARDMIFTLTQLEQVNLENPLLAGILDLEKVGVFGHSYGGASSVRVAQLDDRIDAVAVLDSDIFLVIPEDSEALSQAVLYMTASNIDANAQELEEISKSNTLAAAYLGKSSPYYFINIAGTTHQSFQSDAMFLAPYISIGGESVTLNASNTTPARVTLVISTYVTAFFDQHLTGVEQALLTGSSDSYPEVTITIKK